RHVERPRAGRPLAHDRAAAEHAHPHPTPAAARNITRREQPAADQARRHVRHDQHRRGRGGRHRTSLATVPERAASDPRRRHPYFAAIAPWMIASTSGAEPNRTGYVAGSHVSSASRETAARSYASTMTNE